MSASRAGRVVRHELPRRASRGRGRAAIGACPRALAVTWWRHARSPNQFSMNEEPAEPPKEKGAGVMPDKFLIFDMKTSTGSLGASLTVSVIFCVVVELIKLIDPNPASPSLFAQFF